MSAPTLYNEIDPFAAEWLGELGRTGALRDGTIDLRSIEHLTGADVAGFRRVHLFAGIGGWERALELASWPIEREVWTGSCPCQPFSIAGKGLGENDPRHLWPQFRRLLTERRPAVVFGEQVASGDGRDWLSRVRVDLEALGYAVGAADLCAPGVGAPQIRQRLFWVAHLHGAGQRECGGSVPAPATDAPAERTCSAHRVADPGHSERRALDRTRDHGEGNAVRQERQESSAQSGERGEARGVADDSGDGWGQRNAHVRGGGARGASTLPGHGPSDFRGGGLDGAHGRRQPGATVHVRRARSDEAAPEQRGAGAWDAFDVVECHDGKLRRIEPGSLPLAYGIPVSVGRGVPELRRLADRARANRRGRLRGYGNAIVPELAAVFVRAAMHAMGIVSD